MKNSQCTIYIASKHSWLQKYRREKEGWIQTSRNGTRRPCTSEQVLNHVLPVLAGIKGPTVTVTVEPDNKTLT